MIYTLEGYTPRDNFHLNLVVSRDEIVFRTFSIAPIEDGEVVPVDMTWLEATSSLILPGERSIAEIVMPFDYVGWDHKSRLRAEMTPFEEHEVDFPPFKIVGVREAYRDLRAFPLQKDDILAVNIHHGTGEINGFVLNNPVLSIFPSLAIIPTKDGAENFDDVDVVIAHGVYGFSCSSPTQVLPPDHPYIDRMRATLKEKTT